MEPVIQGTSAFTFAPPPPGTIAQQHTPASYILLPRRLIEDLRDSPLALGVYALVARIYRATKTPVPLSPGDLTIFDPSLTHGATTRALQRLSETGYLLPTDVGGRKHAYIPTWGKVHEAPVPWDLTAPTFGRPRHISTIKLDDRLLDLLVGRLRPHPSHPAIAERYLTTPQLTLRAIGAYAMGLIHLKPPCAALSALGLVNDAGQPLALPDDATILTVASRRATGQDVLDGLTPAGRERAGLTRTDVPPVAGQAPFFVSDQIAHMIAQPLAHMIGDQIGYELVQDRGISASGSPKQAVQMYEPGSHGGIGSDGVNPPHSISITITVSIGGGGGEFTFKKNRPKGREVPAMPPSSFVPNSTQNAAAAPTDADAANTSDTVGASAKLLRGIGVRADVAAQLDAHPPEQVARLINQAHNRPDVRDTAAWVVSALRTLPIDAVSTVPPPPKVSEAAILFHPNLSGFDRQRWLNRFRNADPADRPAIMVRFHAEHPMEEGDVSVT